MNNPQSTMCPAHLCKPGSKLLGVRQNDGTTIILPNTLPIDDAFIEKVKQHPITPERRFRFTNKCIEGGCEQWNGKGCNVADKVVQYLEIIEESVNLPYCSIRTSCRWHAQKGDNACKICPYILTEITEEEIVRI